MLSFWLPVFFSYTVNLKKKEEAHRIPISEPKIMSEIVPGSLTTSLPAKCPPHSIDCSSSTLPIPQSNLGPSNEPSTPPSFENSLTSSPSEIPSKSNTSQTMGLMAYSTVLFCFPPLPFQFPPTTSPPSRPLYMMATQPDPFPLNPLPIRNPKEYANALTNQSLTLLLALLPSSRKCARFYLPPSSLN